MRRGLRVGNGINLGWIDLVPRRGGVTTSPFSPLDLSPVLWLSADVGTYTDTSRTTPTINAGDLVRGWTDRSGTGNHATQPQSPATTHIATYQTNVINGKPVVRFDGDDALTHGWNNGTNPCTVFVVGNRNGGAASYQSFIISTSGLFLARSIASANWGAYFNVDLASSYSVNGAFKICTTVVRAYNDIDLVTNGTKENKTSGTGWYSSTERVVGATAVGSGAQGVTGDIAEIIVYGSALSDTNRAKVETYLSTKYNLPLA